MSQPGIPTDPAAHELLLGAPEHETRLLPAPHGRKRAAFAGMLAGVLVAGIGAGVYLMLHKKVQDTVATTTSTAAKERSVTMYYSDGKTVLYAYKMNGETADVTNNSEYSFGWQIEKKLAATYGAEFTKLGKWEVVTTLDPTLQKVAKAQVALQKDAVVKVNGSYGAFIAEEVATGKVVSWVSGFEGSSDSGELTAMREAGSLVKPFVYATLLDKTINYGAGSMIEDTQGPLSGYPCTNRNSPQISSAGNCLWDYDRLYPGKLSVRYALAANRNVPAVRALETVGKEAYFTTLKTLSDGEKLTCYEDAAKTTATGCYEASALGDAAYMRRNELLHAYATLADTGVRKPQVLYTKVTLNGAEKETWKTPQTEQVLRAEAAYIIADVLYDGDASFLPAKLKSNFTAGTQKIGLYTGATNSRSSSSIVAFSPRYAAGVWFGADVASAKSLTSVSVETMALPAMHAWMTAAHTTAYPETTKPAGIKTLNAHIVTQKVGLMGGEVTPSRTTDLYPSWYK